MAFALAVLIALTGAQLSVATVATAVTVEPLTKSYDEIVNGDYILVGNGVLACDGTKRGWNSTANANCPPFHSGTFDSSDGLNDRLWMRHADIDSSSSTFNSTSATVQVPSGAKVVQAMLYWSGNTGMVKDVSGVRCSSNSPQGRPDWVAPSGSPRLSRSVSPSPAPRPCWLLARTTRNPAAS